MAKALSEKDIERMLQGLSNPYAVRRREDAKGLARVTESNEQVVKALLHVAEADPVREVRDAARQTLALEAHQGILLALQQDRQQAEAVKPNSTEGATTQMAGPVIGTDDNSMFCPSCGAQIPIKSRFCYQCGHSIEVGQVSRQTVRRGFLGPDQISRWRVLSQLDDWHINKPWAAKSRDVVEKLDPPFIPDRETLIFDAPVWSGWGGAEIRIREIVHREGTLKKGYLIATDSRFVFGDSDAKWATQIPYEQIRAAHCERDDFDLVLIDGDDLVIRAKLPHASLLGAVAILGGSPVARADISRMERDKEEVARNFVGLFLGFLNEIVDTNRRWQGQ